MQYLFQAPKLNEVAMEALQTYTSLRFDKLTRFLPKFDGQHKIRISVTKERNLYVISFQISTPKPIFIQTEDYNLYTAIDKGYAMVKRSVRKATGKKRN